MNKKGFTMIELLAVIVLLASIALIVTPLVTNSVKKGEETLNKQTKSNIVAAGKNWFNDNKDKIVNNNCVSVNTLVDNGYLDSSIEDVYKSKYVIVLSEENAYYYKYSDTCASEVK